MIRAPWYMAPAYRWPARFVCWVAGHGRLREAHNARFPVLGWVRVPGIHIICSRCHMLVWAHA